MSDDKEDTDTKPAKIFDILDAQWKKVTKERGFDDLEPPPKPEGAEEHFRMLGHDRGHYYFLTVGGKQVLSFTAPGLVSKPNLFSLAPLHWWELHFPNKSGFSGRAVDQASNYLIQSCLKVGVFKQERMRGLGVWWDDGRSVLHAGNRLIVDGEEVDLSGMESNYVYEAMSQLPIDMDSPLTAKESHTFYQFAQSLNWERPEYGILFAGWTAIAMACGSMPWRPHIMVTGASGCGKSWITKHVAKVLGDYSLNVKGESSEAGIRQALGHSSLPVIWDEAEGEDERTEANMARVMGLMRQSSAELDGRLIKGGGDGQAVGYQIRSMFYLSAIRVPMKQTADENRVTVLTLEKAKDQKQFINKIQPLAKLLTNEFCSRFRARVITLLPVLVHNIDVFSLVAGQVLKDQRIGDQIGPMLAGAYLLHANTKISEKKAKTWMEKHHWHDQEQIHEESDEDKLITSLLEAKIAIKLEKGGIDLSIGELLKAASDPAAGVPIDPETAKTTLTRHGIMLKDGYRYNKIYDPSEHSWGPVVLISNTHSGIKQLLRGTSWGLGWGRILKRINGARAGTGRKSFAGSQSRVVIIPLNEILVPDET